MDSYGFRGALLSFLGSRRGIAKHVEGGVEIGDHVINVWLWPIQGPDVELAAFHLVLERIQRAYPAVGTAMHTGIVAPCAVLLVQILALLDVGGKRWRRCGQEDANNNSE